MTDTSSGIGEQIPTQLGGATALMLATDNAEELRAAGKGRVRECAIRRVVTGLCPSRCPMIKPPTGLSRRLRSLDKSEHDETQGSVIAVNTVGHRRRRRFLHFLKGRS